MLSASNFLPCFFVKMYCIGCWLSYFLLVNYHTGRLLGFFARLFVGLLWVCYLFIFCVLVDGGGFLGFFSGFFGGGGGGIL